MQTYSLFICDKYTPTRTASNTCIDHFHTNECHQKLSLQYVPYDMLDHKMIFIELINKNEKCIKNTTKTISHINYNNINSILKNKCYSSITSFFFFF